jgi:hypothetical protein
MSKSFFFIVLTGLFLYGVMDALQVAEYLKSVLGAANMEKLNSLYYLAMMSYIVYLINKPNNTYIISKS